MSDAPPAGWYPNPENPSETRYWDGVQWTDHTQPAAPSQPAFAPSAPFGAFPEQAPIAGPQEVGADKAVIALICGILGLICCGPLGLVALIMGQSARNTANKTGRPLSSMMQAAWILGIVDVALWAIGLTVYLALIAGSAAA